MFGQTGDDAYTAGKRIARLLTEARVSGTPDSIIALEEAMAEYIVTSDGATKEARDFAVQLQEYFSKARTAKERTDFLNHTLENLQSKLRGASNEYEVLADRMDRLEKRRGTSAADAIKAEWEMLKQLKDEYGDITKETRFYREQVVLLNRLYADTGNEEYLRILQRLNESKKEAGRTTKTAADEVREYIARLREEAATLGMSRKQLIAYQIAKIAEKDSTVENVQAKIKEAQTISDSIDAKQAEIDAIKEQEKVLAMVKREYGDSSATIQDFARNQQLLSEAYARTEDPEVLEFMRRYALAFNEVSESAKKAEFDISEFARTVDGAANLSIGSFTSMAADMSSTLEGLGKGLKKAFPDFDEETLKMSDSMAAGITLVGGAMDSMMGLMEAAGREGSDTYKAFAIAQATMAAGMATMQAWAASMAFGAMVSNPAVGAGIAASMTALIGATLGAQIAQITSANYATGGLVRGPGTGTSDDIPANLSNGEYVLRADAVRKIGISNLNAMNQGRMANFSSGGLVGSGSSGGGAGATVIVNDQRGSGAPVQTRETTDSYGNRSIELLIKDVVSNGMVRGDFDRAMQGSYGIQRPGRRV
jgi:hypothetical protein